MPTRNQIKGRLKYYSAPLKRQIKFAWQTLGKMVDPPLEIPDNLKGAKIEDPLNPVRPVRKLWISPSRHPHFEHLVPTPSLSTHPCYHETPAFIVDYNTRFEQGITQACLLTHSEYVQDSLPPWIADKIVKLSSKHHEHILELIRSAFILDTRKERIPPKIRYTLPWSISRGEVGIPLRRKLFNLIDKLTCFSLSSAVAHTERNPNSLPITKTIEYNTPFYSSFDFGDDMLHIRRRCQMLTLINKSITSPQRPSDDNNQLTFITPSYDEIRPMFPTIGLPTRHIYDSGMCPGHDPNLRLHSFFMLEEVEPLTEMPADQFIPTMILHAYGHARCEARLFRDSLFANDDGPPFPAEPIYVFGIGLVEEAFHFVVFELNSIEPGTTKRNRIWIDADNLLFENFPRMNGPIDRIITESNIDDYIRNKLEYRPITMEKFWALMNYAR